MAAPSTRYDHELETLGYLLGNQPAYRVRQVWDGLHQRLVEPEDMTGVVLFLASDESSKMTGQVLINDAGTVFSG